MALICLKKYFNSRLRGCLIRVLSVHYDGKVVVVAEDGTEKVFYPNLDGNPYDWDADLIICSIQDDVDIKVSKY
jgi:hypothetical protein